MLLPSTNSASGKSLSLPLLLPPLLSNFLVAAFRSGEARTADFPGVILGLTGLGCLTGNLLKSRLVIVAGASSSSLYQPPSSSEDDCFFVALPGAGFTEGLASSSSEYQLSSSSSLALTVPSPAAAFLRSEIVRTVPVSV